MPQRKEAVRKALHFKGAGIRRGTYNIHQMTLENKPLNEKPEELLILLKFKLCRNQKKHI